MLRWIGFGLRGSGTPSLSLPLRRPLPLPLPLPLAVSLSLSLSLSRSLCKHVGTAAKKLAHLRLAPEHSFRV